VTDAAYDLARLPTDALIVDAAPKLGHTPWPRRNGGAEKAELDVRLPSSSLGRWWISCRWSMFPFDTMWFKSRAGRHSAMSCGWSCLVVVT